MANEVRKGIVTAVHSAKAGHPGGSLSAADVFTYLYFEEMNIDPKNPKDPDRDRFVLVQRAIPLRATIPQIGSQRLFPGRGSGDAASYRLSSAGTSVHAAYRRC